ncbi:homocysteine S-methyltransferase family protein [Lentzea sp. NBRC 102530]|uniref:homocysteine S-methyltransferase family protein n=1 Tax=Lentzea sp. NBRC 102530 TaxID=3032201 RepID=UPI0024A21D20|nr:homocysteine S-methyltransferase family protein [Lentzea sp. NBRC 102530]GLY55019.1 homocysteine S-methyltransferase [Lentzea sp. NBRC 102530]
MTQLPQLQETLFLTDGGAETTLIFDDGIDLPDFAAFPLLDDPDGHAALTRYYERYAGIAERDGAGVVLETATWRASADWGARLGYDAKKLAGANRKAVDLLLDVRQRFAIPVVISGCVGPRRDAYRPDTTMSRDEARGYHAKQIRTFADTPADLVTAMTLTNTAEATGIVDAAREANVRVVISFTVETDGKLPSGETLGHAIERVDEDTVGYPAYYMVNCAHPTHIAPALDPEAPWAQRIRGLRANASKLSHAELDEAETLDRGDPAELANDYRALRAKFPLLTVLGGCCGTDHRHVDAISRAVSG